MSHLFLNTILMLLQMNQLCKDIQQHIKLSTSIILGKIILSNIKCINIQPKALIYKYDKDKECHGSAT